MHKEMSSVNAAKRDKARKLRAQKRGVEMTQFVIGDFVLYQDVWYHLREKLPHASRLKFYADTDLNVTADILAHVAHNSEGYEVESIVDARISAKTKSFEVLIKWRDLEAAENSWEPADIIA
ncbi:hypothetical protein Ae201684_018399 [Aphanomyces euteiches]|nr:hypothetical protein Ae201684_018399 [Aphanomyces euteiches]